MFILYSYFVEISCGPKPIYHQQSALTQLLRNRTLGRLFVLKAELPHPVSACVFRIALRFRSNNFFILRYQQTKVSHKKTHA